MMSSAICERFNYATQKEMGWVTDLNHTVVTGGSIRPARTMAARPIDLLSSACQGVSFGQG